VIANYRGKHSGPVAIMANGASILSHDLSKVTCPTIGTNRSWELLWPTYHVVLHAEQALNNPDVYQRLASEGRLFAAGGYFAEKLPRCTRIPFSPGGSFGSFSTDLEQGVVASLNGVGSVAYVALQLAAYMGFQPIYFLGLDLGGPHFHKEWDTSPLIERQNELFDHTPRGLEVWNVGSPQTACRRFPKMAFDAVWPVAA
jgi:hypothetical protein